KGGPASAGSPDRVLSRCADERSGGDVSLLLVEVERLCNSTLGLVGLTTDPVNLGQRAPDAGSDVEPVARIRDPDGPASKSQRLREIAAMRRHARSSRETEDALECEMSLLRRVGSIRETALRIVPPAVVAVHQRKLVGGLQRVVVDPAEVVAELQPLGLQLAFGAGAIAAELPGLGRSVAEDQGHHVMVELVEDEAATVDELASLVEVTGHCVERSQEPRHRSLEGAVTAARLEQLFASRDSVPDRLGSPPKQVA